VFASPAVYPLPERIQMESGKTQLIAPPNMLRIAILGAGQMARQHARAIGRIADVTVTGVVDPDPSALEEIHNARGSPALSVCRRGAHLHAAADPRDTL
jgi:predicted dehydrogenase